MAHGGGDIQSKTLSEVKAYIHSSIAIRLIEKIR
ncbi:hypothetical protein BH20BAC1_BH20BAC1_25270 [soil metagenome]